VLYFSFFASFLELLLNSRYALQKNQRQYVVGVEKQHRDDYEHEDVFEVLLQLFYLQPSVKHLNQQLGVILTFHQIVHHLSMQPYDLAA